MKTVVYFVIFFAWMTSLIQRSHAVKAVQCSCCGKPKGKIVSTDIGGCENQSSYECKFNFGGPLKVRIKFEVCEEISNIDYKLTAVREIWWTTETFGYPNKHIGSESGIPCPLKPGEIYQFQRTFWLSDSRFARSSVKHLNLEILDRGDGSRVVCVEIPGRMMEQNKK
ncbi:NPC intracellular cholesterol transporter 2 homolog a-like [Centruroides vittatus]|uniref:NPC intracellular cholesterol transporter 2 homolog a-like n=1 Tax=Centruroides vittatus TaxID=120091 RepID=UPI00350F32AE